MTDIVTLEDLLAQKGIVEKNDFTYTSTSLKKIFEFEKINPQKIAEIIRDLENGQLDEYKAYAKIIYLSCPLLRTKALLQKFETIEPYDIVDKIFDSNIKEIFQFGLKILKNYGIGFAEEILDIKKP